MSRTLMTVFACRFPSIVRFALVAIGLMSVFPAYSALEKETWLGLPVTYEGRKIGFNPWPALDLGKVQIQTTKPIEIQRAMVTPEWSDLLMKFDTNSYRLNAGEISATPSALSRLGLVDGPSTRRISKLGFSSLKLAVGSTSVTLAAGEMDFGSTGVLTFIRIQMEDGVFVELTPRPGGKLGVLIQTGSFKWPVLPAFGFDQIVAQGELSDGSLVLDRIGANGDGGSVSGVLRLTAFGPITLEGELKMESLRAKAVLERLFPRHIADGTLGGNFRITARADSFAGLAQSVSVSGTYFLKPGSLDRFGLVESMRKTTPGVVGGGLLRFDSLNGRFSGGTNASAQVTFQGLNSGAMQGSGSFYVESDGRLSGTVSGELRVPGGEVISRNLDLSGKVDSPSLSVR